MQLAARESEDKGPAPQELLPEAEPMAVQDIRDALVIRERDVFLLTDTAGQVLRGNPNGYGLYYLDTRYLSGYEFAFCTARPLTLLSTAEIGYSSEQVLTNPAMFDAAGRKLPRGTVNVSRLRVVEEVVEEVLRVVNHNPAPVTLEFTYRFAADFADIFEVRGYEPEHTGEAEQPDWREPALTFSYTGSDGQRRQTVIVFDPPPLSVQTDPEVAFATFRVSLAAQESASFRLVISVDGRLQVTPPEELFASVARSYRSWHESGTRIDTDNHFFNAILQRSLDDIRMLWNREHGGPGYPAAGTPWYDALFGRDTCIAALQTLAFRPEIAQDCLQTLARYQGTKLDPWRDEEPGKILHEMRHGQLTRSGELPFSPYYGSIDSTLLFLLLAGEYYRWTGDGALMSRLRKSLSAALQWLDSYADSNGDGYTDYEKRSSKGLVNQGWKDSWDSIVHADGSLATPPIALCEVQGYAYAAQQSLAPVFEALGEPETAQRLRENARGLRLRFNRDFWLEEEGCYALALDGAGHAAASVASNAGHALWSGIARRQMAKRVAERLMRPDMFSGWGIRTLTSESRRFNPQGYHLGTVWPHDNSLIAMGFKRYGRVQELNRLAAALFDAARMFQYYRLPELFGGGVLSPHQTPVPYPVACRPQAWAAGTFPLITQAILGLHPDAPDGRLYVVAPDLPRFVDRVRVQGLRVGGGEADLLYERRGARTRVRVTRTSGPLQVQTLRSWPADGA